MTFGCMSLRRTASNCDDTFARKFANLLVTSACCSCPSGVNLVCRGYHPLPMLDTERLNVSLPLKHKDCTKVNVERVLLKYMPPMSHKSESDLYIQLSQEGEEQHRTATANIFESMEIANYLDLEPVIRMLCQCIARAINRCRVCRMSSSNVHQSNVCLSFTFRQILCLYVYIHVLANWCCWCCYDSPILMCCDSVCLFCDLDQNLIFMYLYKTALHQTSLTWC